MKTIILLIFPLVLFSQISDSSTISKKVDSLVLITEKIARSGKFKEALPLAYFTLDFIITNVGIENPSYSYALILLAKCQHATGDNKSAEDNFIKARENRLKIFGSKHPLYGIALYNLVNFYRGTQRLQEALTIHLEAKILFELSIGVKSVEYRNLLNSLGSDYAAVGQLEESIKILKQALNLFTEKNDTTGKEFGIININIGRQMRNAGNFEESEFYYLKAMNILKLNPGRESAEYVNLLGSLAILYRITGRFHDAEAIFIEAIDLQKKTNGVAGDLHSTYGSLANLYQSMKRFQEAEEMLHNALIIRENKLGKESFLYLSAQLNLASLYFDMKEFDKAINLCKLISPLLIKYKNLYSIEFGQILNIIAGIYLQSKEWIQADSIYNEALALNELIVGKEHAQYIESVNGLAEYYLKKSDIKNARPYIIETVELKQKLIERSRSYMSELEFESYTRVYNSKLDKLFKIASDYPQEAAWLNSVCYNTILYYKAIQLNTITELRKRVNQDTTASQIYSLYLAANRRVISEMIKAKSKRVNLDSLQKDVNLYERLLISKVKSFEDYLKPTTWKDIKGRLKSDQVAIEFVKYLGLENQFEPETYYGAFIVSNKDSFPKFVQLFREEDLEQLLSNQGLRRMEYVSALYQDEIDLGKSLKKISDQTLYGLIWKPLMPYLNKINRIYFSPFGLLNLINMDAISVNNTSLISDWFELVQLISTRDIPHNDQSITYQVKDASVFGSINYNLDTSNLPIAVSSIEHAEGNLFRSSIYRSKLDSINSANYWQKLPGSELECRTISGIFKKAGITYNYFNGNNSTEEEFKMLGNRKTTSPGLIHVATHGYFFEKTDTSENLQWSNNLGSNELVIEKNEHPMIRTGLILSGANYAWQHGKSYRPELEDGVVTAMEISQLDLHQTELVVLSACETGLGDIKGNEGVYGLQRAFKIAGVKNIMMSLWQVPDQQTHELMRAFYYFWILKKIPVRKALHLAQKEMRNKNYEPYYWAGFVLVE